MFLFTFGSIVAASKNKQVLDKLLVEKERGITVKAQSVSLRHSHSDGKKYLLNLIDTPGHVDFHYEVSRSMAACEGALLVVDASQGIQAQTMANFQLAKQQGLLIIPIINKIDLPHADIQKTISQLEDSFGINPEDCLSISAKNNLNIGAVVDAIISKIPSPKPSGISVSRALLFDSWYDNYRGVIALVSVKNGEFSKGQTILSHYNLKKKQVIQEVGLLNPHDLLPTDKISEGQLGYVITSGMKTPKDALIGDTLHAELANGNYIPLAGFKKPQSIVFAGIFPVNPSEYDTLADAVEKLLLNDSSITIAKTNSDTLGLGYRCGFLGMLHMDVFKQRLENEFNIKIIASSPTVPYQVIEKDGTVKICENPSDFPEIQKIRDVLEPIVSTKIILPQEYLGTILDQSEKRRGKQTFLEHSGDQVFLSYDFPLAEIVENHFFNELKQLTSGYSSFSMDTENVTYKISDIVKMNVLLNGEVVDALSAITHRTSAVNRGKALATKLRDLIDRHLFEISIQVMVNGKSVARETIKALRKNVVAKIYGGDVTRKMKLLEKQKEGKKRMKTIGKIELNPDIFLSLVKKD